MSKPGMNQKCEHLPALGSSMVLVVAGAIRILVIEESPSCSSLLKSSRVISGPSISLKHHMPHKLELEATEIHLDSICECVSDYVPYIHSCGQGE